MPNPRLGKTILPTVNGKPQKEPRTIESVAFDSLKSGNEKNISWPKRQRFSNDEIAERVASIHRDFSKVNFDILKDNHGNTIPLNGLIERINNYAHKFNDQKRYETLEQYPQAFFLLKEPRVEDIAAVMKCEDPAMKEMKEMVMNRPVFRELVRFINPKHLDVVLEGNKDDMAYIFNNYGIGTYVAKGEVKSYLVDGAIQQDSFLASVAKDANNAEEVSKIFDTPDGKSSFNRLVAEGKLDNNQMHTLADASFLALSRNPSVENAMVAVTAHGKADENLFERLKAGNDTQSITARTIFHTQEFQEKFVEKFKDDSVMLRKFVDADLDTHGIVKEAIAQPEQEETQGLQMSN